MSTKLDLKYNNTLITSLTPENNETTILTAGKYCANDINSEMSLDWYEGSVVTSISIATPPTKTSYIAGEALDLTGLVVRDNLGNDVTSQCTFIPANGTILTTESTNIIINYLNFTCSQNICIAYAIGGKIFYIHSANGATYEFYDSQGSILANQTIEGLATAVSYKIISGTPTADKFYVLNTSVGTNGLSPDLCWSWDQTYAAGTSSYNYIGGGKLATNLVVEGHSGFNNAIWNWLKYTVNISGNPTGCTDWYIGTSPNTDSGSDTNTELGKLRAAIVSYPAIFSSQANWFTSKNIFSSTEFISSPYSQVISWNSSQTAWRVDSKGSFNNVCAIRSF